METAAKEIGLHVIHPMSFRQLVYRKLIERFRKLDIDMYRTYLAVHAVDDRFMHQPFTIPSLLLVGYDWKIHTSVHHRTEYMSLRQGLSILLAYPSLRSICRNDDDWQLLIISLTDCRIEIEQCRAGSNTDRYRIRTR